MTLAVARARSEATSATAAAARTVARTASAKAAPVTHRASRDSRRYGLSGRTIQPALRISAAHDPAEREAEQVAAQVTRPARVQGATGLQRSPLLVQRRSPPAGAAGGVASPQLEERVRAAATGGNPLVPALRQTFEPRFRADFGAVRLHTDAKAAALATALGARAFTFGHHIFFNTGQYQPQNPEGLELLAHELTHTIQQQAVIQRAVTAVPTIQERTGPEASRLGMSDVLDYFAEAANAVPGYALLTLIIGRNPINMRPVERSFVNVLRAFMGLIPGGEILFQVLQRYGVVDRLGAWINERTAALGLSYQTIRDAFTRFLDSLSWSDIFSPGDVWNRARTIFTPIISRITSFVGGLVTQAITWLKDTFMEPLAGFCREIPGYGLVTVMLGRDPFTNAAVPRTALTVVRAFAEFIPGGSEKVDQLVQSGALERAYAWFQQETGARNLTWARVTGTFSAAWASLRLEDVLQPLDTLRRMVGLFRPLLTDLVSFAGAALLKLLELIYEAAMGAGGRRILAILTRARATFVVIINNPVGFLRNLLGAVGQGIRQFMNNILTHLRDGVIAWLTGPVAAAGVQMPERWDLRGIIWFVLQILGLTWTRVRAKLVRLIGEPAMATLERGFALINDIRERGLVAALRDRVTEFFGQLRESALGAIRNFIQQRLVMAGITQLLSMLNPVGAIIQAIIKTYTTIQFFIQKINQILDLVESIVNSIAAIASGAIGAAANFVERTMARTIPVILDFLARFIGLGDVGGQVQTTIRNLQAAVDRMLDRAVEWIRTQAARLASSARSAVAGVVQWWRRRRTFRAGGEEHAIYFEGEEASAELTVASTPRRIQRFVDDARQTRTTPGQVAAIGRIVAQIPAVASARSQLRALGATASDAARQPHLTSLDTALGAIGTEIAGLLSGETAGRKTLQDAIGLRWPKPACQGYPRLYLYRVGSTWKLTAKNRPAPDRLIKEYRPVGSHQLRDSTGPAPPAELDSIGIKPPFNLGLNTLIGPLTTASTPGGATLNNKLARYGWSASEEDMDADHVVEIQFGGVDTEANLWPLAAGVNRGAGSALSRAAVQVGTENLTIELLKRVPVTGADRSTHNKFSFKITETNS